MSPFERPDAFLRKREIEESSPSELFDKKVIKQWEAVRPDLRSFEDVYDSKEVAEDEKFTRERTREYSARPTASTALEYMIMDGVESRNWLGETVEVTPTSRYDDIQSGIDMVIRFNREEGDPVFLGVDVTTSSNVEVLQEKIGRTAGMLQKGRSPNVKYYESSDADVRGRVFLPRVVLGTDQENSRRLFQDFARGLEDRKHMETVDRHPLQIELLRQIQRQLVLYTEHAMSSLLRFRWKRLRAADESMYSRLSTLSQKIEAMDLAEETESPEWLEMLSILEERRDIIDEENDPISHGVYMHTDLFEELETIAKQKRSEGIEPQGAKPGTEMALESAKGLLRRAA